VIGAIGFALVVVSCSQSYALLSALAIAFVMAFLARLNVKKTAKKLLILNTFVLYLLIFLPFSVPADQYFLEIFSLQASLEGLVQALNIGFSANAVVLMLFSLVSNLSSSALGCALQWFRVPEKLIQLLQFTLRYLSVIEEEFNRLRRAMRARAFVMSFNMHTWKSIAYLIAMMLIRSMNRAQRILNAMKCRGYQGELVNYHQLKWRPIDSLFVLVITVICCLIISFNHYLG
jgi:cobalt/nickel transport system permease protein